VLIIVIVVAAVLGSRANRYPSYTKLDYALRDTCELTEDQKSFPNAER